MRTATVLGLVLVPAIGLRRSSKKVEANQQEEMRSDDQEVEASSCVDCPSYVRASAAQKKNTIWSRITADEYKVPFETRCAGELGTCVCDGKVKYGARGEFTDWKPVRDEIKCTTSSFGKDPIKFRRKECYCQHEFPMSWVGLIERNIGDQKARVDNGTMPLFYDRFSDENPPNAAKVIHTFGSTALVRFVPKAGTGYTGMFAKGAEHAVLRFSIVADWTKPCKGGTDFNFDGCFKPSMALKMLRDGDYSSNTVAQVNLGDGVAMNFDFFKFAHSTLLPMPSGIGAAIVKSTFKYAAEESEINGVGLQELASDGSNAHQSPRDIRAPEVIFFVGSSDVRSKFSNDLHDVRHDFKNIRAGTKIYDVFSLNFTDSRCTSDGQPVTWDKLGSRCPKQFLGYVESTSRFVASAYQDHRLFFQHERLKTKGGKWARKKCVSKRRLVDTSEFRMAGEQTFTCTQACPSSTVATAGACPFSELE